MHVVQHFLLYLLTGVVNGSTHSYYGITGVLRNQTDNAAASVRRKWHSLSPVKWLEGYVPGTLCIKVIKTGLSLPQALLEEAIVTASARTLLTRGGPWCRKALPYDDRLEIKMVLEAKTAAAAAAGVKAVASQFPNGSLSKHLAGLSYGAPEVPKPALQASKKVTPVSPKGPATVVVKDPSTKAIKLQKPTKRRPPAALPPKQKAPGGKHKPGSRRTQSGVDGHTYRVSKGMSFGSPGYDTHKLGEDPAAAKRLHQQTYRAKKREKKLLKSVRR